MEEEKVLPLADVEIHLEEELGQHNYILINGHKLTGVFDINYQWNAKAGAAELTLKLWAHRVTLTGDALIDQQVEHITQHAPDGTKWEWRLADGETLPEYDEE